MTGSARLGSHHEHAPPVVDPEAERHGCRPPCPRAGRGQEQDRERWLGDYSAAMMPPRTSFETIECSIARTMAILGEPWTALILRDLFIGITRFDALHVHLGVSRKVLTLRLSRLSSDEIVVKRPTPSGRSGSTTS